MAPRQLELFGGDEILELCGSCSSGTDEEGATIDQQPLRRYWSQAKR
jgi:hypothetical protein